MERIRPDEVHLNVPVRPPAETWVQSPEPERMLRAMVILGEVAEVVPPDGGRLVLRPDVSPVAEVLRIIPRHPLRERDLIAALGGPCCDLTIATLRELAQEPRACRRVYRGEAFWTWADAVTGVARPPRSDENPQ
jgi:hypothetical protein